MMVLRMVSFRFEIDRIELIFWNIQRNVELLSDEIFSVSIKNAIETNGSSH